MSVTDLDSPNPPYLWETGRRFRFEAEPSRQDSATRIVDLLERLSDLVRPLQIGVATEDTAGLDRFVILSVERVPPKVRLRDYSVVDESDVAPVLSSDAIRSWLTRELDGSELRRLEVPAVQTRLFTPVVGPVFALLARPHGPVAASFPIDATPEGRWVSAPLSGAVIPPPVSIDVSGEYGELAAAVTITWSWWFEPGRPEFAAMQSAFRSLADLGWHSYAAGGEADGD
jgi:hypothetical protein